MAQVDQAKAFWRVMKSASITQIAREATRPLNIAIVGRPEGRAETIGLLTAAAGQDLVPADTPLPPQIEAFASTSADAGYPEQPKYDLVIDAGGGRGELPAGAAVYSVEELGGWDRVVDRILDDRPDLALALARRFPGLRARVCDRIVRETAMTNAEFAMLNALPGIVPLLGLLLPVGAIGDIFILTKNQAMMLYRLAAAHGLPLDARARARDLAPLLGNAFGWRAVAREVVGVVPGGVGVVARGAIAYAGTAALGRALVRYYETGQQPTRAQVNRFYREAYGRAKEVVRERLARLRGRPGQPPRAALPPAEPEEEQEASVRVDGA